MNSVMPSSSSSWRMWRLSGGCEMWRRAAALVTLDSAATAMNARRWRKSMARDSIPDPYYEPPKMYWTLGMHERTFIPPWYGYRRGRVRRDETKEGAHAWLVEDRVADRVRGDDSVDGVRASRRVAHGRH